MPILAYVRRILAPNVGPLGTNLATCWAMLGSLGDGLRASSTHVMIVMLVPCWTYVGPTAGDSFEHKRQPPALYHKLLWYQDTPCTCGGGFPKQQVSALRFMDVGKDHLAQARAE